VTDRFRWDDRTRITRQGAPVAEDADTDLARLRRLLQGGATFRAGPDGIAPAPDLAPGRFTTRTGGTTGRPKVIRRSHASWIASFEVNRAALGLGPDDAYGIAGSLAHSLALYAAVEAAHLGADIHQVAGQQPRGQVRTLAEAGATVLYATPTQLSLMADAGPPLPAVRHVLCGGGAMSAPLKQALARFCPNAVLREFYGASETSFIAWSDADTPAGAVGRPYPGVTLRLEPLDDSHAEIWVQSPYLFDGYDAGDSPATRRDGAFVTIGELGRLDAAGHLTILGRRDRMVTIAGQNVFPEDIEGWLLRQPGVRQAAVLPVKDARRGTVLTAVVAGDPDAAGLTRRAREVFGPLAAPRRVMVTDTFALTEAGKPDLAALRRLIGGDA
jgi:long-chain acyl-CoA synthetase